jgi:hypothetical protein
MMGFKCAKPGCGLRQKGTVSEMLTKVSCKQCLSPFPHMISDPVARMKIIQKCDELNVAAPSYKDNFQPSVSLLPKRFRISEIENDVAMKIRAGNSVTNRIFAPNAATISEAISWLTSTSGTVSVTKVFARRLPFLPCEKLLLAICKGFTFGSLDQQLALGIDTSTSFFGSLTDFVPSPEHSNEFTVAWNASCISDTVPPFDWEAPDAAIKLRSLLDNLVLLVTVSLSDSLAEEIHEAAAVLFAAHEAEPFPHAEWSVLNIFLVISGALANFAKVMASYVAESPFFYEHYGPDVLWSHPGTSAMRLKFTIRYFDTDSGVASWSNFVHTKFLLPAA